MQTTGDGPSAKTPILSEWLNYWVFVSYMAGPNLNADEPAKPVRDKPEAVTASFLLEDYGDLGIEVKRNPGDPTIFMSWGAVLYVQGPPKEVRDQIDRENAKNAKQARGNGGK